MKKLISIVLLVVALINAQSILNLAFLGNSNTRGSTGAIPDYTPVDNVYFETPIYNRKPLATRLYVDPNYAGSGAWLEMAAYFRESHSELNYVGEARGGSHTIGWIDTEQFTGWLACVNSFLNAGNTIDILWMSVGESAEPDYIPSRANDRLKTLISDIRTGLSLPNLKIAFMYTHNTLDSDDSDRNSAVDGFYGVESEDPNFYVAPMCINLPKSGNHFYFPGYCQMGRQMGWLIESLANGTNYQQARFKSFEYVENNLFKIEVQKVDHLNLIPNDFTGLSAWYTDSEDTDHEIGILYKYIDGKYIYVAVDSEDISLPAKVFVRYQYNQFPDASKYLRYDHWERVPVDKTGHVWEENYVEITAWNITDQDKIGSSYAATYNAEQEDINFLDNNNEYISPATDYQKEYLELSDTKKARYENYSEFELKKINKNAVMNYAIEYHKKKL